MNKIAKGAPAIAAPKSAPPEPVLADGVPQPTGAARPALRLVGKTAAAPAAAVKARSVEPAPETPAPAEAKSSAGLADAAPEKPAAKPATKPAPGLATAARPVDTGDRSWTTVLLGTTLSIAIALALSRTGWYTPGDDVGYYMGLVGGVMMLLLLSYPLRKHVSALRNWGPVKYWFAVHMVLGIGGPVLVLAHSTFHMKSTNASVALICMLVVAGSGIVGRFLYTQVHRGLYGEKLNMKELQAHAGFETEEMRSKLYFVPNVEKRLKEFETYAMPAYRSFGHDALRFVSISIRRRLAYGYCAGELQRAFRERAKARRWDAAKYRRRLRGAKKLINEYLATAQRVSQFTIYDRLLQLWHVAHVPLVYLLVLSAIAHVVAVHMY